MRDVIAAPQLSRLRWDGALLGIAMLVTAIAVPFVRPLAAASAGPALVQLVPTSFAGWKVLPDSTAHVVDPAVSPAGKADADHPYSDVLMRAFGNSKGEVVLLALAYGQQQKQEAKIHRPELCYVAQGFEVLARSKTTIPLKGTAPADGARLLVRSPDRTEAVSYWIRIGQTYSTNGWQTRYDLLKEGLQGRVVDGVLVRVSQIVTGPEAASEERFAVQERFLADLIEAIPPNRRHVLIGGLPDRNTP